MNKKKLKRGIKVGFLAAVGATVLAAGVYFVWLRTPPAMPETVDQAIAVLGSGRFDRLPESRKQAYFDRAHELTRDLDGQARRDVWRRMRQDPQLREAGRAMRMNAMYNRAGQYARATPEQRQMILDTMIGAMEAMRNRPRPENAGDRPRRRGGGEGGQRPEISDAERAQRREGRRERMRERMQEHVLEGDPQRQMYVAEFMKAMRQRREELGLSNGFGGRRGGNR